MFTHHFLGFFFPQVLLVVVPPALLDHVAPQSSNGIICIKLHHLSLFAVHGAIIRCWVMAYPIISINFKPTSATFLIITTFNSHFIFLKYLTQHTLPSTNNLVRSILLTGWMALMSKCFICLPVGHGLYKHRSVFWDTDFPSLLGDIVYSKHIITVHSYCQHSIPTASGSYQTKQEQKWYISYHVHVGKINSWVTIHFVLQCTKILHSCQKMPWSLIELTISTGIWHFKKYLYTT